MAAIGGWTRGLMLAALVGLGACKPEMKDDTGNVAQERAARNLARQLQAACSSPATYDRLKQVAFDEAIRIRNADPANLELLAANVLVRVEQPRVVSRDETLDVTVCSGRMVMQVPPGAERAFAGQRQLTADIEYAAQAAADGSGLVYQIKGAEPIVYKLATFDLKTRPQATPTAIAAARPAPVPGTPATAPARAQPAPAMPTAPRPAPRPAPPLREAPVAPPPRPTATLERAAASASPSFNCRRARSRSEQMVCGNGDLAALDRAMSSRFYSTLATGAPATQRALRTSRDRFLAYRERCPDESCVASAYRDRMDEIADIAAAR